MTKEIIKAMKKNNSTNIAFKWLKWWRKNSYKIWRVILFPFWLGEILKEKYNTKANVHQQWNEERAINILNYYIPRRAEWDEKEQCFYFFDNGMGWGIAYAKKFLKRKDRRFWQINSGWWGGEMRTFLIEKFELEGFTKEIGVCDEGWTEISFYLNKEEN